MQSVRIAAAWAAIVAVGVAVWVLIILLAVRAFAVDPQAPAYPPLPGATSTSSATPGE
nr:hypothetical protein [Streptomyces antibioticus]